MVYSDCQTENSFLLPFQEEQLADRSLSGREGTHSQQAGVLKFLSRYRETGTIAHAPGTGQASKLIDQIRKIIKDQMKKNDETTGMEL